MPIRTRIIMVCMVILSRRFFLDPMNVRFGNAEHDRQLSNRSVGLLDKSHIFIRKFCFIMSSLGSGISHIIVLRTNKQMFRVNTSWVIARMANICALWNWCNMGFIRKSMSMKYSGAVPEASISASIFGCSPFPASGWRYFVFRVKSFFVGKPIAPCVSSNGVLMKFFSVSLAPNGVVMGTTKIASYSFLAADFAECRHVMGGSFGPV